MIPAPDDIPVIHDDPFSEETLTNPRDYQTRLTEAGPVVWLSKYGFYAVGQYASAAHVLSNWEQYTSARGVGTTDFAKEEPWWGERAVLIESDPPRHNEIRRPVTKILSPRAVEDLAPEFRQQANLLLDQVLTQDKVDAQTDIANVYPLKVFGDALGIDSHKRENLLVFGDMVFNSFGPQNKVREQSFARAESAGALDWMKTRTSRDAVREGSIGHQLHQLSETDKLTPHESANVMRGQLAAGVDTTVAALGFMFYCFAQFPEQYQLLRADKSLAKKAFEEAVRHLSPIQSILRTTTQDAELLGVPIRADHKIVVCISAGNHDPKKWDNPHTYDINRNFVGHLGFGRGVHACVGLHVAKLEAESLLHAFIERVKSVTLVGEPQYKLNNTVRGLSTLPVSFEEA